MAPGTFARAIGNHFLYPIPFMNKKSTNSNRMFIPIALAAIIMPAQSFAQNEPQPMQLTLKGSWPGFPRGYAHGLCVVGNYAYT